MNSARCLLLASTLVLLLTPRTAWAYLDPGTGSYMLQVAAAGLLASMFTIKLYWQRVKVWFRALSAAKPPPDAPASAPAPEAPNEGP